MTTLLLGIAIGIAIPVLIVLIRKELEIFTTARRIRFERAVHDEVDRRERAIWDPGSSWDSHEQFMLSHLTRDN